MYTMDEPRMTMREFRASIAHVAVPTYVGDGIWFPDADPIKVATWLTDRSKPRPVEPPVAARAVHKMPISPTRRGPYLQPEELAQRAELQRRRDEVLRRLRKG